MSRKFIPGNAGPYQELLFTPGKFNFGKRKFHSITKIYVSTMESVVSGRENWGIPKEQADFFFEEIGSKRERITVKKNGASVFEALIKKRCIRFPVNTKFFPLPLLQKLNGKTYLTRFSGKGKGQLSRIESMKINPAFFPDISRNKPLASIGVNDFSIEFPEAKIIESL